MNVIIVCVQERYGMWVIVSDCVLLRFSDFVSYILIFTCFFQCQFDSLFLFHTSSFLCAQLLFFLSVYTWTLPSILSLSSVETQFLFSFFARFFLVLFFHLSATTFISPVSVILNFHPYLSFFIFSILFFLRSCTSHEFGPPVHNSNDKLKRIL